MNQILKVATILLFFISVDATAKVDPPNLEKCEQNVSGIVTRVYSDNWAQKTAFEINDKFYYLTYYTTDLNIDVTFNLINTAKILGSQVTILECQGNEVSSVIIQ